MRWLQAYTGKSNSDPVDLRERRPKGTGRGEPVRVAKGLGGNTPASRLRQKCLAGLERSQLEIIYDYSAMARFQIRIGFFDF